MQQRVLLLLFVFFTTNLEAQSVCVEKAKEVYKNIVSAIGNNYPPPPALVIKEATETGMAASGKEIIIEMPLLNNFCGKENFEDKIAYFIAHELAHHYLSHPEQSYLKRGSWLAATPIHRSLLKGADLTQEKLEQILKTSEKFLDKNFKTKPDIKDYSTITMKINKSLDKKKQLEHETQADIHAGFFSQLAGYNALSNANDAMIELYRFLAEEFPEQTQESKFGRIISTSDIYPTLDQRIEIIDENIEKANELTLCFEWGTIFLKLKKYEIAKALYEHLIKSGFISREIYNNLGLTFLLYAASNDETFSKFNYPVHIDINTRAEVKKTRSFTTTDFDDLIEQAEKNLNTAITLDPLYTPAKKNLLVLEFIKHKKAGTANVMSQIAFQEINQSAKTDLEVIEMMIDQKPNNKIKIIAQKGSKISEENLSEKTPSIKDDWDSALNKLGLGDFTFGISSEKTESNEQISLSSDYGLQLNIKSSIQINSSTKYEIGVSSIYFDGPHIESGLEIIKTKAPISQFDLRSTSHKGYSYFIRK